MYPTHLSTNSLRENNKGLASSLGVGSKVGSISCVSIHPGYDYDDDVDDAMTTLRRKIRKTAVTKLMITLLNDLN